MTSMLSYFVFFGDDVMLTRECFSGDRYNNKSEIRTSKCFFWHMRTELCNDIFCSTRRIEFTGEI